MSVLKNSQSGFSLIEMLVAVVIIAVGLLGLAQLQITAVKVNSQSMTSTASKALAQKVAEEISALSGGDAMFADGQTGTWGSYTGKGGGNYTATWAVSKVVADGNDVSKLFNVEITIESDTALMHVLGQKKREVVINILKRTI